MSQEHQDEADQQYPPTIVYFSFILSHGYLSDEYDLACRYGQLYSPGIGDQAGYVSFELLSVRLVRFEPSEFIT